MYIYRVTILRRTSTFFHQQHMFVKLITEIFLTLLHFAWYTLYTNQHLMLTSKALSSHLLRKWTLFKPMQNCKECSFCRTCFSLGDLGVQVSVSPSVHPSINIYHRCLVNAAPLTVFSSPEPKAPRWAYSIPMVRRPSVVVHTFKLEYLWRQLANLDRILCVALLGCGKGCIRFWGRLDQNSGFHGNRKPPLTYNGENDVSTFSRLFLTRSFLYLQVTRTCIKSRTRSNFGQIGPLTTELAALERLKKFP